MPSYKRVTTINNKGDTKENLCLRRGLWLLLPDEVHIRYLALMFWGERQSPQEMRTGRTRIQMKLISSSLQMCIINILLIGPPPEECI